MDPNRGVARRFTTKELVRRGWDPDTAQTWADLTGTTPDEIARWHRAGFTPQQAQTIHAIAWRDGYEPDEWLDVETQPVASVAYAEAVLRANETETLKNSDQNTLRVLKELAPSTTRDAVRAYKAEMRKPGEFDDLVPEDYNY